MHDVVTRIEQELGRAARPFDLSIDILAVTYPPVLVQGEHHAVISGELVGDETGYQDWLYRPDIIDAVRARNRPNGVA